MLHYHLKATHYVIYFQFQIIVIFSTYPLCHIFLQPFPAPFSWRGPNCAKFGKDMGQSLVLLNKF